MRLETGGPIEVVSATFNSSPINETHMPDKVYPGQGPDETAFTMIYPGYYPDVGQFALVITLDNLVTDPPVEVKCESLGAALH